MEQMPAAMDRHLDVASINKEGGLLLGASSLTGRYWLGSLWFYLSPEYAPNVELCTAGVQLEAGLSGASWITAHHVLLAMDTGGVTIWELQDDNKTFSMVHSACEHDDIVSSVSVNANGNRFVSASHDKRIRLWDANLTSLNSFKAHGNKVLDVQYHPTEPDLFLSCSQDGRTILWDTRRSKPASIIEKSQGGSAPCCVSWQPSATKMFGTGDEGGDQICWHLEVKTAEQLLCL
ncbi:methylosome protein 50-like isoform X3 [Pomacea canaliculata]|uniref:methylosome protein 50-like isoform X3 n=1 Tax=Pomacea canaliculata TaxID=400727 RepID=UPI000D73B66D|nr:methylosome protein 50-like isoform X3 [Pomacea canaliculata]